VKTISTKALLAVGVLAGLVLFSAAVALAQSAKAGKDLYVAKGCVSCHGPDGKMPLQPLYPKLAGQNAPYLVQQLKAFKTQQRKSGQSVLMFGMAAQLSDSEMEQISAYLAQVR